MSLNNERITHLIKFGDEEHMRALYEKGTVYMNTIEYFRVLEEEGFNRGDSYEATNLIVNITDAEVFILDDNDKEQLLGTASHMHFRKFREQVKGNLYCMYAVHPGIMENGTFSVNKDIISFGSHCVVINKGCHEEFCKRVFDALLDAGFNSSSARLVTYYDHEKGLLTSIDMFMKRIGYRFQNEFRIYVNNDNDSPITLQIGSLHDIASIHETKSIIDMTFSE